MRSFILQLVMVSHEKLHMMIDSKLDFCIFLYKKLLMILNWFRLFTTTFSPLELTFFSILYLQY
jgi:hypothetical protein